MKVYMSVSCTLSWYVPVGNPVDFSCWVKYSIYYCMCTDNCTLYSYVQYTVHDITDRFIKPNLNKLHER